jgi:hypothetical protein
MGDQPVARPLPTQYSTQHRNTRTHIHASSRIRTHDPSVLAVEDSTCLRPRGHWDRPKYTYHNKWRSINSVRKYENRGLMKIYVQVSEWEKRFGRRLEKAAVMGFIVRTLHHINEYKMRGACITHGRDKECTLNCGRETWREEITWKTEAYMVG